MSSLCLFIGVLLSPERFGLQSIHTLDIIWTKNVDNDYLHLLRHVGAQLTVLNIIVADSIRGPPYSYEPGSTALWTCIPSCSALEKLSLTFKFSSLGVEVLLDSFQPDNCLKELHFDWPLLSTPNFWALHQNTVHLGIPQDAMLGWRPLDAKLSDEWRFPHLQLVQITTRMGRGEGSSQELSQLMKTRFSQLSVAGKLKDIVCLY